jgi:hypothetical protein
LTVLTHTITGVYGAVLIASFFIPFIYVARKVIEKPKTLFVLSILSIFGIAIICSPWIYVTSSFLGQIVISQYANQINYLTNSIDWFWTRVSPIPFDLRTVSGIQGVRTPFLEAQTNICLFCVWILCATRFYHPSKSERAKKMNIFMAYSFTLWLIFFLLSLIPSSGELLPELLKIIQFSYRLVTYQNLAALLGLAAILLLNRKLVSITSFNRVNKIFAIFLVIISASGLLVKLMHARTNARPGDIKFLVSTQDLSSYLELPLTFYGISDYSVASKSEIPLINPSKVFRLLPDPGVQLGKVLPLAIDVSLSSWYPLNIQSFPWNHVYLDGVLVQDYQIVHDGTTPILAVFLSKGKHHISYAFEPTKVWRIFDYVSLGTIFALLVVVFLGRIVKLKF